MTAHLEAQFTKCFRGGTVIEADLCRPADRFSVTVLFGPSGCGKTTILRCLAGLERPETGRIALGGVRWFDAARRVSLTPQQRDIGYLFQEYALFPHLTAAQNIAYGLARLSRSERRQRVANMLDLFQLTGLDNRYPHQVSGGQQQRIALARVLARRPRLLLLDEPLSALDASTREQLRRELRRLLAEFGIPVLLVTHDRVEAMSLADHLVVMDAGKCRQQGPVADVFTRPVDLAVAHIVGMETVQPGQVLNVADGLATVAVGSAQLIALAPEVPATAVHVCIRAEEVVLQREAGVSSPRNRLEAEVASITPEGPLVRVGLDCGFFLTALLTRPGCAELALQPGDKILALIKASSIHLIPRG
jgi:molybdate transport system ATP-binding protein